MGKLGAILVTLSDSFYSEKKMLSSEIQALVWGTVPLPWR